MERGWRRFMAYMEVYGIYGGLGHICDDGEDADICTLSDEWGKVKKMMRYVKIKISSSWMINAVIHLNFPFIV